MQFVMTVNQSFLDCFVLMTELLMFIRALWSDALQDKSRTKLIASIQCVGGQKFLTKQISLSM